AHAFRLPQRGESVMKMQTTLLGLAVICASGLPAVAGAQDARLDPKAKVDATVAADRAVDSAHTAHADAKAAREAATEAKVTESSARTVEGAQVAGEAAKIANQSALEAR